MITVFLRGGLGNQMFQYAAGLSLAKKNGTELVLDTVFLQDRFPRRNFTYREFQLDAFAFMPQFTELSRAAAAVPVPGAWLAIDLVGITLKDAFGLQKMVREPADGKFDPAVLAMRGNLLLWGVWQNEKYFADIADDARSAFRFRTPLAGEADKLAEKIVASNSVSLHVRRADYAKFKNIRDLMGETDLGYYARAVAYVGARVQDPHFFIFSDDLPWCRENLKLPFPVTYVGDALHGPKDAFYLELMSLSKHSIIANSTFSWWGAWLNANPRKIVVAPKRWYANLGDRSPEIIPASWVSL